MVDIALGKNGDMVVTPVGDISLTNSVKQAVLIRLRWIFNEWRLGPELGFPWFEEVFVKNPNIVKIKGLIREEILRVDGVTGAEVDEFRYDAGKREARIRYTCHVGEEVFREEVALSG